MFDFDNLTEEQKKRALELLEKAEKRRRANKERAQDPRRKEEMKRKNLLRRLEQKVLLAKAHQAGIKATQEEVQQVLEIYERHKNKK